MPKGVKNTLDPPGLRSPARDDEEVVDGGVGHGALARRLHEADPLRRRELVLLHCPGRKPPFLGR